MCERGDPPPDPEPQTTPQEISTGPVTAVRFASVTSKYELSERNAYSMPCRANLFEPMGMTSELLGAVLRVTDPPERPPTDVQVSSCSTTDHPRTKSPECGAPRLGCFDGVA
jgi:hypothetical protein